MQLEDLRAALDRPDALLSLLASHEAFAVKFAVANLQPRLEEWLPEQVLWADVRMALQALSMADLKSLADDPDPLESLQSLVKGAGPIAVKWGMAQIRSTVEPLLPVGVVWSDMEAVLQDMELADIEASASDPHRAGPSREAPLRFFLTCIYSTRVEKQLRFPGIPSQRRRQLEQVVG